MGKKNIVRGIVLTLGAGLLAPAFVPAPARAADVIFDIADQTTEPNPNGAGTDARGVWFTVPTGVVDNRGTSIFPNPLFEDGKFLLVWDTKFVQDEAEVWVEGLFANGNDVLCTPDGNPKKFGVGALHRPGAGSPSVFTDLGPTFGNWELGDSGFLGLVFPIAGQLHYGFAEITVNADASITLHDFGYSTVANQPITTASLIPEPAGLGAMALALVGLASRRRR